MAKYRLPYDLHMHSCLSPCGDMDMTPNNIAGMCAIKELKIIALTDHNTGRNVPALMKTAGQYGLIVIPGMELTTMEEACSRMWRSSWTSTPMFMNILLR